MCSFRYLLVFAFLNLCLLVVYAEPNVVFDFKNFGEHSKFESQLALYGDAMVVNGSLSLQNAGSGVNTTTGRVYCRRPFRVLDSNSSKIVSFSSYFVFSSPGKNRDGLSFLMLPIGYPWIGSDSCTMGLLGDKKMKCLAFKFYIFKDEKYGDLNGNSHLWVNVESPLSVKPSNASSINLVLSDGEKLQSWIDYEASSKRFEVRLSKFGSGRPLDPSVTYPIDLSKMWNDSKIILGLSSSTEKNSSHKINIFAWSFSSRTMPHWMRSHPIDPEQFADHKGKEVEGPKKKSDCAVRIIVALILGAGCGAMGAFFLLFVWILFGNKRPIVPEDVPVQKAEVLECKKFDVVVEKSIEDGKN